MLPKTKVLLSKRALRVLVESLRPLNVVLIGLGMVADTHLAALADLKNIIHLKGIYARSQVTMNAFGAKVTKKCGYEPQKYQSIEDIAADSDLDFAIVVTPPNARKGIVDVLSNAGIHILIEKPIERDSNAAVEIVELCEERKVHLGVVFQHRVRAASIKAQKFIDEDQFGKLALVEVTVPWWREQSYYDEPGRGTYQRDGGGVLISQAIHTLDLMLCLTGSVSEVQAMAGTTILHKMESEDFVSAGMRFNNGAFGSLSASTASFPGDAESITLHFEDAVVLLMSGKLNVSWRDGRKETFGADATTGGGADPMAFTHDWHADIIRNFAEVVSGHGSPVASGRDGLKVHSLIDALIESSRTKRAVKLK